MHNLFLPIAALAGKRYACTAFCVMAQIPRVTGAPGVALSAHLLHSLFRIDHKVFATYVHKAEITASS
jgi:hypothetical protein